MNIENSRTFLAQFDLVFFEDVSNATVASYIRNTGGAKNTCYAEEGLPYTSGGIGCSMRPTVCVGSKDASCTALSHLSKKTLTIQKSNERSWLPFSFHVGVDGDDDDCGDDKDKDNEQCEH